MFDVTKTSAHGDRERDRGYRAGLYQGRSLVSYPQAKLYKTSNIRKLSITGYMNEGFMNVTNEISCFDNH
jgi:hypothetical protein